MLVFAFLVASLFVPPIFRPNWRDDWWVNVLTEFWFALLLVLLPVVFPKPFLAFLRKILTPWESHYTIKGSDLALNDVIDSLSNTRLIFVRAGNFGIGSQSYSSVIRNMLNGEGIWDYHIHLAVASSKNTRFLEDFFVINNDDVQEVRPLTTTQLVEIPRKNFMDILGSRLKEYDLEGIRFLDAIMQGVIEKTTDFPRLSDLNLAKLTITKVTLFVDVDRAYEVDKEILQAVGVRIIETAKEFIVGGDIVFIGEQALDPTDPHALKAGRKMYLANH